MHNDNCPTRWEAERQGRDAYRDGCYEHENPYRSRWGEDNCREAEREWQYGYERAQEQAREDAVAIARAEARAQQARREEAEAMDAMFERQMQQQYEAQSSCDICRSGWACHGVGDFAVCSFECQQEAERRMEAKKGNAEQ